MMPARSILLQPTLKAWIPAYAGMTEPGAGMTELGAGMTRQGCGSDGGGGAGMTALRRYRPLGLATWQAEVSGPLHVHRGVRHMSAAMVCASF
jgi:hypothetical protein